MRSVKIIGREFYGQGHLGASSNAYNREIGPTASTLTATMFPSLRELLLSKMPNLEEWSEAVMGQEDDVFPCLELLSIVDCPMLTKMPSHFHESLKTLTIRGLTNSHVLKRISTKLMSLTSLSLSDLQGGRGDSSSDVRSVLRDFLENNATSLKHFLLEKCHGLSCLTLSSTLSLEVLKVEHCYYLTSIITVEPAVALKSLRVLYIDYCPLPSGHFEFLNLCTSLRHLTIVHCPTVISFQELELVPPPAANHMTTLTSMWLDPFSQGLDHFPLPYLSSSLSSFGPSLSNVSALMITGSEMIKLKSLPDQLLQHPSLFPSLTYLYLKDFNWLEDLPDSLGNLSSLQSLCLRKCTSLKRLPLLEVMQRRLSKLKQLIIISCPHLEKRCAKGSGPEWQKIEHIPHVEWSIIDLGKLRGLFS